MATPYPQECPVCGGQNQQWLRYQGSDPKTGESLGTWYTCTACGAHVPEDREDPRQPYRDTPEDSVVERLERDEEGQPPTAEERDQAQELLPEDDRP